MRTEVRVVTIGHKQSFEELRQDQSVSATPGDGWTTLVSIGSNDSHVQPVFSPKYPLCTRIEIHWAQQPTLISPIQGIADWHYPILLP